MCRWALPMPDVPSIREVIRFLSKAITTPDPEFGDCWLWTAYTDKNGYGGFKWRGRKVWAHRFSYAFFCGDLVEGMQVHHRCHNPSCVNPSHLELATHSANAAMKRPRKREAA